MNNTIPSLKDTFELIEHRLKQAEDKGAAKERERIIKLIEETLLIHADQKFFLVRSIKGEQK
jgi:hypothetical protein